MTLHHSIRKIVLLLGVFMVCCLLGTTAAAQAAVLSEAAGATGIRDRLNALAFVEREVQAEEFLKVEQEFLALSEREALRPSDWRMMIHLALRTWNFERVEAYRQRSDIAARLLEDVSLPPNVRGAATPVTPFWQLDAEGKTMRRSERRIDRGLHFLTVFHPKCSVCKRLISDIEQDATMQAFWRRCATWIGTVEGNFSLEVFGGWAARHPTQSMVFIQDWGLIGLQPIYETPIMFLLQDGVIQGKLVGYPPNGAGKAHIASFLQVHGVEMARGCGR